MPHLLIATDADWIIEEVLAALGSSDTTVSVCRSGKQVAPSVAANLPDLVILDMQVGNMGAMAIERHLRLEASGGRLPPVKVLLLLDRSADVFLAQRSDAEGWLVKPVDALRLRRAATAVMGGGRYAESAPGVTMDVAGLPSDEQDGAAMADGEATVSG
ncbi:MAG TPA: response regulator [Acidimicrobiales bacterium]